MITKFKVDLYKDESYREILSIIERSQLLRMEYYLFLLFLLFILFILNQFLNIEFIAFMAGVLLTALFLYLINEETHKIRIFKNNKEYIENEIEKDLSEFHSYKFSFFDRKINSILQAAEIQGSTYEERNKLLKLVMLIKNLNMELSDKEYYLNVLEELIQSLLNKNEKNS